MRWYSSCVSISCRAARSCDTCQHWFTSGLVTDLSSVRSIFGGSEDGGSVDHIYFSTVYPLLKAHSLCDHGSYPRCESFIMDVSNFSNANAINLLTEMDRSECPRRTSIVNENPSGYVFKC